MMARGCVVVVLCLARFVYGVPLVENSNEPSYNEIPSEVMSGLSKCTSEGGMTGIINCAAFRILRSLQKFEQKETIEILPGVTFTSNTTENSRVGKELNELPKEPNERTSKLFDLIINSLSRFISSRTLKVKLPDATPDNLARALEEGRGKMKKMMGPLMLGLGAKMITVVPIMLGGLALLAAKALLVGKLAFVISIILFIQYFFSGRSFIGNGFGGNGGYGGGYGGTYTPYGYGTYAGGYAGGYGGGGGTNSLGGWGYSQQYPYNKRSLDVSEQSDGGQELAYSSQKE